MWKKVPRTMTLQGVFPLQVISTKRFSAFQLVFVLALALALVRSDSMRLTQHFQ